MKRAPRGSRRGRRDSPAGATGSLYDNGGRANGRAIGAATRGEGSAAENGGGGGGEKKREGEPRHCAAQGRGLTTGPVNAASTITLQPPRPRPPPRTGPSPGERSTRSRPPGPSREPHLQNLVGDPTRKARPSTGRRGAGDGRGAGAKILSAPVAGEKRRTPSPAPSAKELRGTLSALGLRTLEAKSDLEPRVARPSGAPLGGDAGRQERRPNTSAQASSRPVPVGVGKEAEAGDRGTCV